ncbi:MAG: extracellular solute-binding protein, family 7 [Osedax symbiont Rs1]|nr:MAG: extracellular solute-binding protein, family 7 [Osedax symbiont Rs1]
MKRMTKMLLIASLVSSVVAGNAIAEEKNVLLKTQIAFGTNLPALGSPILEVAKRLHVLSKGSIKMKVYEPGKLVAPSEILGAVSAGKFNSGYATPGYWQGKIPASALFSAVPFGPEASEYLAWIYYGNGRKLWQEMYDTHGYKVHTIPCAINPPETSGWFAKPIDKPDDLKGLNMRFFGLGAKVMEKLGVGTVQLPGGEIFGALEKGAIDATEFSLPQIDQRLGFHKIVKYNYFPGWHQQATLHELLINKDTWQAMSSYQQEVVETTCKASVVESLAEGEANQFEVLAKSAEKGVKLRYWNPLMLKTFKTAWDEVVIEQTENQFFKKVWDDMSGFRKGYDLWESYAYLPREKVKP